MASEWYESFFTALALDFWAAAVPATSTAEEVDFVVRELGTSPPARILDLPSGLGRHSIALASRGYRVTGVDISAYATLSAKREASARGLNVTFLLGDMRDPPPDGPYDGAVCLGNSFGYLSRRDMRRFVQNIFHTVRPSGRWVIDSGAVAESLLPHLVEERTLEAGGVTYAVRNRYDATTSRLLQACTLVRGQERQTADLSYTIYTVAELHQLLEHAGWTVLSSYGSLDGRPFREGDRRLFLIAQRPEGQGYAHP
jgi:SAM-dependent methyltransferase